MKKDFFFLLLISLLFSCGKGTTDDDSPGLTNNVLRLKLQFQPEQIRLNSFGEAVDVPLGHGSLTPDFHAMSVHFIELVPTELTLYKDGVHLHSGEETSANNPNPHNFVQAIDFEKALIIEEDQVFLEFPLKDIPSGTYRHIRTSVSYQNYDVKYNLTNIPSIGTLENQRGTIASFVGFNTFLTNVKIREQSLDINDFKLQGFWAFETDLSSPWSAYNQIISGQAPEAATTVVNPFPNAPIPVGSCVVSGSLDKEITITGLETEDLNLTLSFSINNSFEWEDSNNNNEWDIDVESPQNSEKVVDMGLRGLIGKVD